MHPTKKKTAQNLVMHPHDEVIINSQRGFKELQKSFSFVFGDFFPQTASFSLTCVRVDEKKVDVLKTLSQRAQDMRCWAEYHISDERFFQTL